MGWFDRLFGEKEPKREILIRVCVNSLQITKRRLYGCGSIEVNEATVTITFNGQRRTVIAGIRGSNLAVTSDISLCGESVRKISERMEKLKPRLGLPSRDGIAGAIWSRVGSVLTDVAIKRFGNRLKEGETIVIKPRSACTEKTYEVDE